MANFIDATPDYGFLEGMEDPFGGFLAQDPRFAYFGRQGQFGRSPAQKRFFENEFSNIRNQFLGTLGSMALQGQEPIGSFSDYIGGIDFNQRFAALPPALRGASMGRFAPQTRFLF